MAKKRRRSKRLPKVLSVIDTRPGPVTFLEALGSAMDIAPTRRFHIHPDPWVADAEAIHSDWEAVGRDLLLAAGALTR